MEDIKQLISQMTLEEKASLCSGQSFWHTQAIDRLGVPAAMVSDGPHGLRKQDLGGDHLGVDDSIKAVCFPAGCATAASFDRDLVRWMGETLGKECQAEDLTVLLGPAANIKRSPLCGRNFEYYSEDPCLAGQMASAFIGGVQSKNVGTSLKHFLANNQEHRRMSVSAEIDERTLREIYLAAFETPVREQKPWTVMCSYNKINGTYAAENKTCLTDILRGEWGFDGFVVSDWGAVNKRPEDLAAGLDLEMPSSNGRNDAYIVQAVREGKLDEAVLDQAVERILNIVYRHAENKDPKAVFDREADHQKARAVAEGSIVLLKNEGALPLEEAAPVVFIGQYAKKPRYQGGGSSHINSFKVTSALDAAEGMENVRWVQGFEDSTDLPDQNLIDEAVQAAQGAKAAVIFAGLPDSWESEGFDREHMHMPENQNKLIEAVAAVQPNTVVVLHNGAPVEMPWADKVNGILETYLGGQAVGEAVVNILFGRVNPSGKLPETFPLKLEDNPSYLYFPGEGDISEYKEGIFVGYRYYDRKKMNVLFPFGHGLSYTSFAYSNLRLDRSELTEQDTLTVSVDVTNTGSMTGREIVQLYVSAPESKVLRPEQELRDFAKVELKPGETKTVTFRLAKRAFSYWETRIHDWYMENGRYEIRVGASSRDIRLTGSVTVTGTALLPLHCTPDTILADLMEYPELAEKIQSLMKPLLPSAQDRENASDAAKETVSEKMMMNMILNQPLHALAGFTGKFCVTMEQVDELVDYVNKKFG